MAVTVDTDRLHRLADEFLGAWNTQEVDAVLDCYTPDVRYRDPNTRGHVEGAEALGRYLAKLFAGWRMRWRKRELYALAEDGAAVLWTATLAPHGREDEAVEVDGMDLVLLEGDRIARNDVYFDRAALAGFLAG
ncbi:MAG: nuclear transport factor 2 family protein [Acidimicrobiia bacterium]|nr:nuclear transport factor 2 family protein [Acidimicrobiia bacterium]